MGGGKDIMVILTFICFLFYIQIGDKCDKCKVED